MIKTSDEFFNDTTYSKKWNTKKNLNEVAALLKKYPTECISNCPTSWVKEVSTLLNSINKKFPNVKFIQFKEKFGTLRVYFSGTKDEDERRFIEKMIDKTEIKIIKKLKYPFQLYKCKKCKHTSTLVSVEYLEDTKEISCFYCGGEIKKL